VISRTQQWMLAGGLLLAVLGILFGFTYAYRVQHQTLLVLRESYSKGFVAAAQNEPIAADRALQQARLANYRYGRIVDVHTHIIKLASVLLLGALLCPLIAASEARKRALAVLFAVGACVFPAGVLAEVFWPGRTPQAMAAAGALLVIFSFAGMTLGLLSGLRLREKESGRMPSAAGQSFPGLFD
jgi:hypothetical protein